MSKKTEPPKEDNMEKFWTKQNSIVGTAHMNRKGEVVDFRPASEPTKLGQKREEKVIILQPPKGVQIDPLRMPATLCDEEVIHEEVDFSMVRQTWAGQFEGVEFTCIVEVRREKNTPEAEACRAERAEVSKARQEEGQRRNAYVIHRMRMLTAEELIEIAQPTSREWGQLEHDSAKWKNTYQQMLHRAWEHFESENIPVEFTLSDAHTRISMDEREKKATELKAKLLEIRAAERARRKAESV